MFNRALSKPFSSIAATTGIRSNNVTLQPNEANTNASRPKPAVASNTCGVKPCFKPIALAMS